MLCHNSRAGAHTAVIGSHGFPSSAVVGGAPGRDEATELTRVDDTRVLFDTVDPAHHMHRDRRPVMVDASAGRFGTDATRREKEFP